MFPDHIVTSAPYWTTVSAANMPAPRLNVTRTPDLGVVFFGGKGCFCTRPLVTFFAA